ncbi:Cof-type HAD-IIB family hydrolase [Anaerosacchariphilus polymeriproducens]|uniref:Cof-type HAD-IIB family hydrolase n=1 Tax=Anaerosacchariphilus polymeriproducens TaxID=1812858 RepID=A0A371AYR2_9FIRM|nr:Cof-type HAD-IIB family hydrolase [Anaerosacchariphilus polymeriproducens]RDU24689.1 Cof-type HAD-IIB family hydrolase [Anaerosacchariphilus polymeriproducens]
MTKYIFLDIDGTLFDHKTNAIPQSALFALKSARSAGHKIFICTGRSFCQLEHVKQIDYHGVVCSSGAFIVVGDKIIFQEHIDIKDINNILELCTALNIALSLEGLTGIYMQEAAKKLFLEKIRILPEQEEELLKNHGSLDFSKFKLEKDKIYKISLYCRGCDSLDRLKTALGERFNLIITTKENEVGNTDIAVAELTLTKNNKATGIKKVMSYYNADMADTISIGDSMNDIEMLEESYVGIAMGNADPRLKEYADFITTDIDKNGLYHAFLKYHLIEN